MGTPTTNKGYTQPTIGGDSLTWGNETNANWAILDNNLAASNITTTTGGTTTLTSAQAQCLLQTVEGVLTSNAVLQVPALRGLYLIANDTTGAFTLTVETTAGGSAGVVAPPGLALVYSNGTNVYPLNGVSGPGSGATLAVVDPTNPAGANIVMQGDGAATPNKTVQVHGGKFNILANDGSTDLLILDDSGNIQVIGNLTVRSTVTVEGAPATFNGAGTNTPTVVINDTYASSGYGAGIQFVGANGGETVILTGPTGSVGVLALYTVGYGSLLMHIDGSGNLFPAGIVASGGGIAINNQAASWNAGAGAPTAVAARGSLFSRTDGALGSTLYVSQGGGVWNAVAGV